MLEIVSYYKKTKLTGIRNNERGVSACHMKKITFQQNVEIRQLVIQLYEGRRV